MVLTQLNPIAVIFTLPQDNLDEVAKAIGSNELAVAAYSRDGDKLMAEGTLKVLDNQVNTGTASLRLKAVFDNPQHVLWPNQFVKARLTIDTRKGATVIAAAAIQRGPDGSVVYVLGEKDTVALRKVEVDSIQGTQAIISKGLTPGEKVVTDGQSLLKPGATVDPRTGQGGPGSEPGDTTKVRK